MHDLCIVLKGRSELPIWKALSGRKKLLKPRSFETEHLDLTMDPRVQLCQSVF